MLDFFKQYIPYYKNYKLKFFYAFIGMVSVSAGTAGTAYIIKPLLDDIFIAKDEQMLSILPLFIILLYAAQGFGKFMQAYFISYIGQDIIRIVRDKLLAHVLTLDIDFFQKMRGGELISRIINDINRIQIAVSTQIAALIRELFTAIALIAVVIYQSPELAFYGLVIMPLAIYPVTRLAKRVKKLSYQSQESNSDITSHLSETFNNIEIIKANSVEDLEVKKFSMHNLKFFNINIKAVKLNELVSPIMEIIGAIAVALVIIFGGKKVISGELSTGEFFSFMTALFMLYTPIKRISSMYNSIQDALAANIRVNKIIEAKATIKSGNKLFPKNISSIEFKNVNLKYGKLDALSNINLKVNIGEKIALVGDSGGGKSSLINLLVRFYNYNSGEINFNDETIENIDLKSLRDNISIVTQRVYIFNDTIANNISYGHQLDEKKVIESLKQAHAYDFVQNLEDGIYTTLDEFGTNLSGGQRQRIAIARALYKDPQILILDEATSALDNESESIITEVIDDISKNRITFVIAHRLSTIKNSNKIAVFKDGKIVCLGNQAELLETCKEYQRLHNLANI